MIHNFTLYNEPFNLIKNGKKTVEMRLYDEKRKVLKLNEHIIFTNTSNNDKLEVSIVNIRTFTNFKELYSFYDKEKLGYLSDEVADPDDMLVYYDLKRINKYGVCAIEIKLI